MSDPWSDQDPGQQPPPPPSPPVPPAAAQQPGWGPAPAPGQQLAYGQEPAYGEQPVYGQAPGYGLPPGGATSGKSTTVMVLGIVSLVLMLFCGLGFIPAIIALVMAGGAEREIAGSGGALGGAGQLKAGRVMAWVTLGLTALALLLVVGLVVVSFGVS